MLLVNKGSHYEKQNGVSFLKKLQIELPQFSPIPLPGYTSGKKRKTLICKDMGTPALQQHYLQWPKMQK